MDKEVKIDQLKSELFMRGDDAIRDFLGYDYDVTMDKDLIEYLMDDVLAKMPDEELEAYFDEYLDIERE